jgi:hypothetical protein
MTTTEPLALKREDMAIAEKKRVALAYLTEAWEDALAEGVDPEILAHAAMFTAFADMVAIYGEEAVATLAEGLGQRIRSGEFSLDRSVQ